jgi:hypothetical protein
MKRSFDNFAIVDGGLSNKKNSVPFLNVSGTTTTQDPFGGAVVTGGVNTTPTTTWVAPLNPTYTTPPPTYNAGQTTTSGGVLSNVTAQQLNALGSVIGQLGQASYQIYLQSQQAKTVEEQLELQRQAQEIERQRIEAMNNLAQAQRQAGVPVTASGGKGLSTGAIIGIVAGGVVVIGLIMFLALRPNK